MLLLTITYVVVNPHFSLAVTGKVYWFNFWVATAPIFGRSLFPHVLSAYVLSRFVTLAESVVVVTTMPLYCNPLMFN